LQFDVPKRVVNLSTDGGFVFVEGNSTTGIPVTQVQKVDPPAQ
jgi:hypothetical protein